MRRLVPLLGLIALPSAWADLEWSFTHPEDARTSSNLQGAHVANGLFAGQSVWDPYLYLRLPEEGIGVSDRPYLTVRLYSSSEADVLDVYYKCSDGRWGLGATHPIKAGWGIYRADMRKAAWHETNGSDDARQWGGPTGRIISFRIDPGNQMDRWISVDYVKLTAEPTGPPGVEQEARGTASELVVKAPAEVTAGEKLSVQLSCNIRPPAGVTRGTVLFRILSTEKLLQAHQAPVTFTQGGLSVRHEFPTSLYAYGGQFEADARVLELDGEAAMRPPVRLTNPRTGNMQPPQTRVGAYRGEPALFVDDKPVPAITYLHHGGPDGKLHAEMARTGIKVYSDWFGASTAGDLGQVKPGIYNYSGYDKYFATVLDAVPDAYFLPHIGLTAPMWWQKLHPEERCLYSNGSMGPSSMASELWKKEMAEDLRRLINHLREAPYADRILGYIFYSGYTAEWQMWATWKPFGDDYSPPAVAAFRSWLSRKYASDSAVQRAWNDPDVTLQRAQIPSFERLRSEGPFLRDPAIERQLIDYNHFTSDMVADAIVHFARVTKQATAGTQVAGTYYGYMAAHGARQVNCGHNALGRVLQCPEVDFLMSPPMYANRQLGGTSTFMSATESVKLHGKLWLDESDLRTYLSDPSAGYGRTKTPEGSMATAWREFANVLTRKAGVCWFDMSGGWFSGKPMWEVYTRQMQVAPELFNRRQPFVADVALFTDERSNAHYRPMGLLINMLQETISHMPQSGVTWDFYLQSDIGRPDLPAYKLYALLNPSRLDEATHRTLVAKARREGASILYMHAPGYALGDRLDAARIESFTGMRVKVLPEAGPATYRVVAGHGLTAGIDPSADLGPAGALAPRPIIVDEQADVIARYSDGAGVAMARKTHDGVPRLYCTSVMMPVDLWRDVARAAGAFVHCETNDALHYDGQVVALHAAEGGEKVVRLPEPVAVSDLITGELIHSRAQEIRRQMTTGQTVLWELGPAR